MRFVKFGSHGAPRLGMLSDDPDWIVDLSALAADRPLSVRLGLDSPPADVDTLLRCDDAAIEALAQLGSASAGPPTQLLRRGSDSPLLAPIARPMRNVFCVGLNYRAHVAESGTIAGRPQGERPMPTHPEFFSKPASALVGPADTICRHAGVTDALDYEVELAVIIGRGGADIEPADAMRYVFGYAVANDVSARDLQFRHGQWFKGKSLDRTCPVGPAIVHRLAVPDPHALRITCRIGDEILQDANTSQMVFDIPTILSQLSRGMSLQPGDMILTGTPSGVGAARQPQRWLRQGDVVVSQIEGVGTLSNPVE